MLRLLYLKLDGRIRGDEGATDRASLGLRRPFRSAVVASPMYKEPEQLRGQKARILQGRAKR